MADPKALVAVGVGLFCLGIILGHALAGGTSIDLDAHRCHECDERAQADAMRVAMASAAAAQTMTTDEDPVQPTALPPIDEESSHG